MVYIVVIIELRLVCCELFK